jgi:hypothetical protein
MKIRPHGRTHLTGNPQCPSCYNNPVVSERFPQPHADADKPCSGLIHAEEFAHGDVLIESNKIIYRCDTCQEELLKAPGRLLKAQ